MRPIFIVNMNMQSYLYSYINTRSIFYFIFLGIYIYIHVLIKAYIFYNLYETYIIFILIHTGPIFHICCTLSCEKIQITQKKCGVLLIHISVIHIIILHIELKFENCNPRDAHKTIVSHSINEDNYCFLKFM
jgi:hypothetical protein